MGVDYPGRSTAEYARPYFLILDRQNPAVLVVHSKDRWSLPCIDNVPIRDLSYGTFESPICQMLQRLLEEQYGVDLPALFILYRAHEEVVDCDGQKVLYEITVLEAQGLSSLSAEALWVTKDNVDAIKLTETPEWTRAIVKNLLCREPNEHEKHRLPWAKPGWFRKAQIWTSKVLDGEKQENVHSINPRRGMTATRVAEIKTEKQAYFFKAVHPASNEVRITRWLSEISPEHIPKILGVSEELNAMITEDFRRTHREGMWQNRDKYAEVYQSYARLQLRVIDYMKKHGVEEEIKRSVMTPMGVAKELEEVLNDEEMRKHMREGVLVACQAQYTTWVEMCSRLENSGVPCSVVNTDLRARNFARARKTGESIIFDWGIGCITHPFSNLHQLRDVKGVTEAHVESYLSLWTRYVPDMKELKRMERLCRWFSHGLRAVQACREARVCECEIELAVSPVGRTDRDRLFRMSALHLERMKDTTQDNVYASSPARTDALQNRCS